MDYDERINICKTTDELFAEWKTKQPVHTSCKRKKNIIPVEIDHTKNVFIADGAVNETIWNESGGMKIVYLLKEAYGEIADWNLAHWLHKLEDYPKIWRRVAEWTYGIYNTTVEAVPAYCNMDFAEMKAWMERTAVVNLKKSGGKSTSDYDEVYTYAMHDQAEIRKELEILQPDIIVCGATLWMLDDLYDGAIKKKTGSCDNWFYVTDQICNKRTVLLDYYHPANHYPALVNYYAVTNIYQQALKSISPHQFCVNR